MITSEKGRKVSVVFFVLFAALLIYFFWSGVWLPKLDSPGEVYELENLMELETNKEAKARVLTPLQGLADAVKSLGEVIPDGSEESETIKNIKNFSQKTWNKIYEILP